MRGQTLSINVSCDEYTGPTRPVWIRGAIETPWLDASAALSDDGWVTLAVVNISEDRDYETKVIAELANQVEVYTVTGQSKDVVNTWDDKEKVRISETTWDGKGNYVFKRLSLTLLRWKA